MNSMEKIRAERTRQIEQEGFDREHDNGNVHILHLAAVCYLAHGWGPQAAVPMEWPWSPAWWKPTTRERALVKAGALFLAAADEAERTPDGTGVYLRIMRECRALAESCGKLIDIEHGEEN